MSGGVYCPLSACDPIQRRHLLLQQTQSRLVLVHSLTSRNFNHDIVTVDIDLMLNNNVIINVDRLASVATAPNDIAYIIFTSGSTGTPKAVSSISA